MPQLAQLYELQGELAKAETLLALTLEAAQRRRGVGGDQGLSVAIPMSQLGRVLVVQRKYVEAEAQLRPALDGYLKTNPQAWNRYHIENMLGASLAGQKKNAEAEALLAAGYAGMLRLKNQGPVLVRYRLQQAGQWIVQFYEDSGKPEKAMEWRNKLAR